MAILKDTTILGDARVTDTLYANNQQVDTLTTSLLNINTTSSAAAATLTQLDFTDNTTSYGVISANTTGAMTLRSKRILAFFAAQSSAAIAAENYQSTNGVYIGNGLMWPAGDMDLGTLASRWNKIYTKAVAVGSNTNDTTYPFYVYNTQTRFSLGTSNFSVTDRKFTIAGGSGTNLNELSFGNEAIQAYNSTQTVKDFFLQPRGGNIYFGQPSSISTTAYSFSPNANNQHSLGTSSYKWANIYSTTATLNGLNVIGGDIVMSESSGHGATHKLIFQRGTATDGYTDWEIYNDSVGVLTFTAAQEEDFPIMQLLCPTSGGQIPALVPCTTNSYDIGSSSLKWKDIYATTLHGALTLSEITGADDLQAIEALSGTSGLLKKTAANTWTLDTTTYSTLTLGTTAGAALAATASAGTATTAAKSDHVHPFPTAAQIGAAASSHTHGIIDNDGTLVNPSNNNVLANRIPYSNSSGSLATTTNLTFDGSMIYTQANATSYKSGGAADTTCGLNIVNGTTVLGHIGHNGNNLILYNCTENATMSNPAIIFRTALTDASNGMRMNDTDLAPVTTTLASALTLGSSTNKWQNVYAGLITPNAAAYTTTTTAGIVFYNSSALCGHIGAATGGTTPGSIGLQTTGQITFRAGATLSSNVLDGDSGINFSSTGFIPKTNAAALDTTGALTLGSSTAQWATTYSKQYVVDTHVTLAYDSTDKSLNFNFT